MSGPLYFELFDDMSSSNRWYLAAPTGPQGEWLAGALTSGGRYAGGKPLQIEVYQKGPPLELTLTLGGVLVVNERVADIMSRVADQDVQLVQAQVQGESGAHFVVNVLPLMKCIDEQLTAELRRWGSEDGQPERVGEYSYVSGMKIDSALAKGHQVLRPWGWSGVVLASVIMADALRFANVRCQLTPVT